MIFMRLIAILLVFFDCAQCVAQNNDFDSSILIELKRLNIPGLAVAKVEGEKVAWSKYYGYQNLENQIPVTENTIFQIASVSKTITAAAIMQLIGQGTVSLDDDVNNYLPFSVKS